MEQETQRKRAGKRLLVAAIGVAAVSYVSTQSGCAADGGADYEDALSESDAPYDDEEVGAEVEGAAQALAIKDLSVTSIAKIKRPPIIIVRPPVGNLVPPPVGNLMAPPIEVIRDLEAAEQLVKGR